MFAPCKDCPDRGYGCHAKCKKYRAFRAYVDERAEKKREFQKRESDFYESIRHPRRRR